jgi:hypothetical protein
MEKVIIAMLESYHVNSHGECDSDYFPSVVSIGYDEQETFRVALDDLKHSCCADFTDPHSCKPGYRVRTFFVDAYRLEAGEDAETIIEEQFKFQADSFQCNGDVFIVPYTESQSPSNEKELSSDTILENGEWPERF